MLKWPTFSTPQSLQMVPSILDDLLTIQRISAVPAILQTVSETTGLRFAAVARVSETSWTACAVLDRIEFGLKVGGELDVTTTLCSEIHTSQQPIIITQVSADPDYCDHHTPAVRLRKLHFGARAAWRWQLLRHALRARSLATRPFQPDDASDVRILCASADAADRS